MKISAAWKLAILIIAFIPLHTFSQDIMHSAGGSVNYMWRQVEVTTSYFPLITKKETSSVVFAAADYMPSIIIVKSNNSSLSLGIPLSAGIGSAGDINSPSSEKGFYYQISPSALLYYNYGLSSTRENESHIGFFGGAGLSYSYMTFMLNAGNTNIKSYGPALNVGMRFTLFNGILSVGLFGRKGMEQEKSSMVGLKLMQDFR